MILYHLGNRKHEMIDVTTCCIHKVIRPVAVSYIDDNGEWSDIKSPNILHEINQKFAIYNYCVIIDRIINAIYISKNSLHPNKNNKYYITDQEGNREWKYLCSNVRLLDQNSDILDVIESTILSHWRIDNRNTKYGKFVMNLLQQETGE